MSRIMPCPIASFDGTLTLRSGGPLNAATSSPLAASATLSDRNISIETPEHVALSWELAGAGSRFVAFLYDALILMGIIFGTFLLMVLAFAAGLPAPILPALLAIVLLGLFALTWGYFVYFEGFRDGQTPGKRRMGLRVVQEGGFPLTVRAAAIRNLLRIVDSQPFPSWILGGLFVLLNGRSQRVGDMAAGTIVVREQRVPSLPEDAVAKGPPRLPAAAFDVLREYAARRDALERPARDRLSAKLVEPLAPYMSELPGARLLDPTRPLQADALLMQLFADESARRAATTGVHAASGSAAATSLLRRQRERWLDFDSRLKRVRETKLSDLSQEEVSQFAALYREIASDLARARTYGASPQMLYTLERSVGAGHNLLYTPAPRSARRLAQWLRAGFPALVRRRAGVILLAALLLYGPAIAGFASIVRQPERATTLLPPHMIARAEEGVERQARGEGYVDVPDIMMPLFSSTLIANNVQVTFFAFAGGVAAGLGTIYILVLNGISIGAVIGLFHTKGLALYLWSFILPHGVLELTAICIAGGAGLLLGSALILPGRRTRRQALRSRGAEAVSLLAGTTLLLVLAGLIEGFVSPSLLPAAGKLAFGAATALVLFPYLILSGRTTADPDA